MNERESGVGGLRHGKERVFCAVAVIVPVRSDRCSASSCTLSYLMHATGMHTYARECHFSDPLENHMVQSPQRRLRNEE